MDRITCIAVVVMLAVSILMWGTVESVRGDGSHTVGYEGLLFDTSAVHTIDIRMDDWDSFIANATAEEYTECAITIDGEKIANVGIRGKGNTSLSSVAGMGSRKYSFKIEFDHFVKGRLYKGLDKLSLNNLIYDATMMKDYLAYTLMNRENVPAPLCSFAQITVNGEPWGLYLAVEGVEDAFLERNNMAAGEVYKPDSMSFGGGRGNGRDFDFDAFRENFVQRQEGGDSSEVPGEDMSALLSQAADAFAASTGQSADDFAASLGQGAGDFAPSSGQSPEGFSPSSGSAASFGGQAQAADETAETEENQERKGNFNFGGFGMGSSDVKLQYTDDDPDSYANIFDNAKTDISKKDKARLVKALKTLSGESPRDAVFTDEVIRYLAVHDFLQNADSYTGSIVHNYYLYEENGRLAILPWDYNLAFGAQSMGFGGSDATALINSPIDSPVSNGSTEDRPLVGWIFQDEDALAQYHEAYDQFVAETVESGWLADEISRVQEMITPFVESDPTAFYTMDEFSKAVETMQAFCEKRGESVRGQLDGTIPSTSEGQRNSSALVDASEISTADMGSMNGIGGAPGGMPGGRGGFSMPGMGSQGGTAPEGFSIPEGMPMPQGMTMPGGTDDMGASFGGSAGGQAGKTEAAEVPVTAGPEATALPAEKAAEGETAEKPAEAIRPERPSGMPEGRNFPSVEGTQADQSGLWIQAAVWSAVLLAALLIIRRAGSHNQ